MARVLLLSGVSHGCAARLLWLVGFVLRRPPEPQRSTALLLAPLADFLFGLLVRPLLVGAP